MPEFSLFKSIRLAEVSIADQANGNDAEFWRALDQLDMILCRLVNQGAEPAESISENASQRISLTTGLLQASVAPVTLIREGQYWAAAAVLRQQLEALARINLIRNGHNSSSKATPNVSVLPGPLPATYGRLSELAHVSGGELLQSFVASPDSAEAATAIPKFKPDWSSALLHQHVQHLFLLAVEIELLQREIYPGKLRAPLEPDLDPILNFLSHDS